MLEIVSDVTVRNLSDSEVLKCMERVLKKVLNCCIYSVMSFAEYVDVALRAIGPMMFLLTLTVFV